MSGGDAFDRLEDRAARLGPRLRGRNLSLVAIRVARRFIDTRVTGLAAEMTYYTVLSIVPLLTGLGASLGLLGRLVGPESVRDIEAAIIRGVESVLSDELIDDVVAPLIQELLRQERTGIAIGGLLLSIWLASRVFRAAIRALDDAYDVEDRRTFVQQWTLALGFTGGAVVLATVSLALVVIGPLLGGGQQIAEWIGAGQAFEVVWAVGRWPLLALVSVGFLTWLYGAGPNVDNGWRTCLPGALVASLALVLVAGAFRTYLDVLGPERPDVAAGDEAVQLAGQLLGVLAATLVFVWLSNITILLGGVFNAEWSHADHEPGSDPPGDQGVPAPL
ncbi:MAG: YihY/virulence factor BrkB family protein [Acidimicrobiales bacterium]